MYDLVILQDQHTQTKSILIYEIISIKADGWKKRRAELTALFSYSSALFSKAVEVEATTHGLVIFSMAHITGDAVVQLFILSTSLKSLFNWVFGLFKYLL